MSKMKPRTLSGFMELLPAQQVLFDRMKQILASTYQLYGFTPLDTPLIEASEVLLAKGGGETEKQIYRFTKGDADLSLRFDLTVPLAKYVALHYSDLSFPFRRYQIGKVYRGERAQRGRYREFYQADIDIIGDGKLDISNEAEIPSVIYQTFTALGLRRFKIRVNNRKVLGGLFSLFGLGDQATDVMRAVDKLEKIGRDKVIQILTEDCAVAAEAAGALLDTLEAADPMAALEGLRGKDALLDQGIEELSTVVRYMGAAARRGHLHRPDPAVLCAGRTGPAEPKLADGAGGCADPPHDRRFGPGHHPGHPAAGRLPAGAAIQRTQKIQSKDLLCRQTGHPLCDLFGGRRSGGGRCLHQRDGHRPTAERAF